MADIHGLKPNVRPNTPYNVTAQIRGDIRQIVRQEIEQIAIETIGAETPAGAQAKVDASALSLTAAIAAAKAELQLADDAKAALVHTHDDRYYLKAQVDSVLAGKASSSHAHDDRYYTEGEVDAAIATRAPASHNHNDQYYTEAEVDMALAGKAESSHTHPGVYYTVAQADALLATKAPLSHNHNMLYYSISQIDTALAGKADLVHDHNDRYYTEAEIDLMLTGLGGGGGDGWTPVTATTTAQGIVELATNSETTTGTDATRAVTPAGVKAALDAKALSDMSTYAPLAHKTRHATGGADALTPADIGAAPALGADDNYVNNAEKTALHSHANKTALDAVSGTNTGDQDLSGLLTTTAAPELIRDTMGTALVAGANVTITPDDGADTITIAATGGGGGGTTALWLPGVADNGVSCPDSDALSNITTAMDLIWHGALENYTETGTRILIAKKDAYYFAVYNGKLYFLWWDPAGTSLAHDVVAPALASYEDIWIRCSFEASTGSGSRCRFYRSADGASWEQVGTTRTSATATQIRVTANPVHVGQSGSNSGYARGLYRKVIIKNGIDGAVAAEWDGSWPHTRQRDAYGNIWTVNGTANAWQKIV